MTDKIPAFDERAPLQEQWDSLNKILSEAMFKKTKLEFLIEQYTQKKKRLQLKVLEDFKQKLKMDFMEKYKDNIKNGKFSKEMLLDFTKLEEAEKHGCYHLNGIKVWKDDCNICNRRCKVNEGKEKCA